MLNKIKKHLKLFTLLILFGVSGSVQAQQYPIYSQYLFNGLILNPAYAGSHVQFSASTMYRNQWVNFEGAPKTLFFSAHTSLLKEKMGLGLIVSDDRIGSYSSQNVYASYAFIIKMPKGKLAMGLQAGVNLLSADYQDLNLADFSDVSFANLSKIKPNFGTGIYYYSDKFYAGFSIPFLLNSSYADVNAEGLLNGIRSARYYYLNGGIKIPLNRDKTVQIQPSILIRGQEGAPLSMDINSSVIFYDLLNVGLSYRNIDALVSYIDIKLSESFHFSYSYDWTTSAINRVSNGTHEFMINYRFKIRSVHGNIECPNFYQFL
jgi:type IX secretion system PorP/SprF family membrane protein